MINTLVQWRSDAQSIIGSKYIINPCRVFFKMYRNPVPADDTHVFGYTTMPFDRRICFGRRFGERKGTGLSRGAAVRCLFIPFGIVLGSPALCSSTCAIRPCPDRPRGGIRRLSPTRGGKREIPGHIQQAPGETGQHQPPRLFSV